MRVEQTLEHQLGHLDDRERDTWLAVADWLDHDARLLEEVSKREGGINAIPLARRERSLAVARAYLGTDS